MSTLAERLKQARLNMKLTQEELCEKSKQYIKKGVSQQLIAKIETGETKQTSFIVPLAKTLNCDAEWLQFGKGEAYPISTLENISLPQALPKTPLLEWKNIDQYLKACLNDRPLNEILTEIPHTLVDYMGAPPASKYLIALIVGGNAMEPKEANPDALYHGDRVYIDPTAIPSSYTTVLAQVGKDYVLRQFVHDGTRLLLKPLNPDQDYKSIQIPDISAIKGVVVGVYREKQKRI